jgi:hypothetical protein
LYKIFLFFIAFFPSKKEAENRFFTLFLLIK